MRRPRTRPRSSVLLFVCLLAAVACNDAGPPRWAGSIDTLSSGQVVVSNPDAPLWPEGAAWRLTEELRIGALEEDGPELFGQIRSLAVDDAGRIYVLESQAQEVRVFGPDGSHVRTIGRPGGGPGEFSEPALAEIGARGDLWVTDPDNNRVSVFDTAGAFVRSHPVPGGFIIVPWPGGFDRAGNYHYPVPDFSAGDFRMKLVKHDGDMQPADTLSPPTDPVQRERFELTRGPSRMIASVPFDAGFRWRLGQDGTLWGGLTGEYRIFELSADGDTIRSITRAFAPVPVTRADRQQGIEDLEWFTEQGGEVDVSKIPSHKPAFETFTFDAEGRLWVWPVTGDEEGQALDVFDDQGRYLGRITSPVPLASHPSPVISHDAVVAVTRSELDVPFVVRLRIERPEESGDG